MLALDDLRSVRPKHRKSPAEIPAVRVPDQRLRSRLVRIVILAAVVRELVVVANLAPPRARPRFFQVFMPTSWLRTAVDGFNYHAGILST